MFNKRISLLIVFITLRTGLSIPQERPSIGARAGMAANLTEMAEVEMRRGLYSKALKTAQQALKIYEALDNQKGMADTLRQIGEVYRYTSQYDEALSYAEQSWRIAEKIKDKSGVAASLNNMGTVYETIGHSIQALEYFQKSLKIREELGEKSGVAACLNNIGVAHRSLGNYNQALEYGQRALKLREEMGSQAGAAAAINNIGLTQRSIGNYTQALEEYQKALAIREGIGDKLGVASSLNNIGGVYRTLGNYEEALEYYQKSLRIREEMADKKGLSATLNNMGEAHHLLGNYTQALDYFNKALKMTEEIGRHSGMAIALNNIGSVHKNLNNYAQALPYYQRSLEIKERIGNKNGIAVGLINMGSVYNGLGDGQQAIEYFSRGLALANEVNNPETIWKSHEGMAEAFKKMGNLDEALAHYRQAVEIIEDLRNNLRLEKQKVAFFEGKVQVYEELINLLIKYHRQQPLKGFDRESFHYAEKSRARALLDSMYLERLFQNLAEISDDLRQKVVVNEAKLEAHHRKLAGTKDAENRQRLERETEKLEREKNELIEQIKEKNPRFYQLVHPKILSVEEVQPLLKKNQFLIEYFVGKDNSIVWVIGKEWFRYQEVPLGRMRLRQLVAQIRKGLATFQKRVTEGQDSKPAPDGAKEQSKAGHELYQFLFQPIEPYLKAGSEIIIVPDDMLHYIPFEMLVRRSDQKGTEYLIEKYPVSYRASASLLDPSIHPIKTKTVKKDIVLAFGNPDFGTKVDSRLMGWLKLNVNSPLSLIRGDGALKPLPYSEKEVYDIAGLIKDSKAYIGSEATEERFKTLASQYKVLHIATHNLISEQQPMYSRLIFSQVDKSKEDGSLFTYEIFNLRLNADLVVLSACQSGLGKLSRGEGLIGMSRAFLYAGAPSLVVSLWMVDDESTAMIMRNFYQNLAAGMSKPVALQKAKLAVIKKEDAMSNPFYWAPFVIMGDGSEMALPIRERWIRLFALALALLLLAYLMRVRMRRRGEPSDG